jgi:hypothetical protein
MKLVYDQLPTRAHKVKIGGQTWQSLECSHCSGGIETFDHLLTCSHPTSITFRIDIVKSTKTFCGKKGLTPTATATIVNVIQRLITNNDPIPADDPDPKIQLIRSAQSKIGWTRFIRGFLSKQWLVYLAQDYKSVGKQFPPGYDFCRLFSGLIKIFWTSQSKFWTEYQTAIHKPSIDSATPIHIADTRNEIRDLYNQRFKVPADHRDNYFPKNIHDYLKTSTHSQLLTYLLQYKPAIQASIKLSQDLLRRAPKIYSFRGFSRSIHPTSQTHIPPRLINIPAQHHLPSQSPSTLSRIPQRDRPTQSQGPSSQPPSPITLIAAPVDRNEVQTQSFLLLPINSRMSERHNPRLTRSIRHYFPTKLAVTDPAPTTATDASPPNPPEIILDHTPQLHTTDAILPHKHSKWKRRPFLQPPLSSYFSHNNS